MSLLLKGDRINTAVIKEGDFIQINVLSDAGTNIRRNGLVVKAYSEGIIACFFDKNVDEKLIIVNVRLEDIKGITKVKISSELETSFLNNHYESLSARRLWNDSNEDREGW